MKYLAIIFLLLIVFSCTTDKHTLFPQGVMHKEPIRHVESESDMRALFVNLSRSQNQALFLYHYPDLVIPPERAAELRILPPTQVQMAVWVYLDERRFISFTDRRMAVHDLDDRMNILFQYGFPDNIYRFDRRDGILEKWDYYQAGVSFTFLDGAEYRSTQY